MIVEVALSLNESLDYYIKKLEKVGAINFYSCKTHDVYYTNVNLDGMTEEQMKKSCVRFRVVEGLGGIRYNENEKYKSWIENYNVFDSNHDDRFFCEEENFSKYEDLLLDNGYKKVFDTKKNDYQYKIGEMKSMIQLQMIDGIGLVLYYDNPDFYNLDKDIQRSSLIDELKSYGIDCFDNRDIDKLRSLFYGRIMYKEDTL